MKPPEIFKLIVRAFGVYALYQASSVLPDFLIAMSNSDRVSGQAFLKLAGLFGVALWFLFGAPPVQRFAYPEADAVLPAASEAVEKVDPTEAGPPCVSCGKRIPEGAKTCPSCGWTQPFC